MGNKNIQVGLDIGKKKLDMCVQGSGGEVLVDHRTFSNSYRGYQALKKEILAMT
jgi:hypothetical protein